MACYTLGVLIDVDDINDATGNTDTSKNLRMYLDYTDCSDSAKTIFFETIAGNIDNNYTNICINWNEPVTMYYYKNNTVQTPGKSYATDFDTCTESVETSILFSCVNVNGLRAYNVSEGYNSPDQCLGNDGPWPNVIYGNNPNAWGDCTRFYEDVLGETPFDGSFDFFGEESQSGLVISISDLGYINDTYEC